MHVRATLFPSDPAARRVWLNFSGFLVLAGAVELVVLGRGGLASGGLRAALPAFYYGILPVLASISVGMLAFNASVARHAVIVAALTTLLMVAIDLLPATPRTSAGQPVVSTGGALQPRSAASAGQGGSALRTIFAFARGDLVVGTDRPARYPAGHPRLVASTAASNAGRMLLPAVLMGIVLGIQAWVSERVTFRTSWDGRLAHLVVSWVVAPATFFLIMGWVHRIQLQVLFGTSGLASMFLPYIPFTLIAAIGWFTSWRALRWTAG